MAATPGLGPLRSSSASGQAASAPLPPPPLALVPLCLEHPHPALTRVVRLVDRGENHEALHILRTLDRRTAASTTALRLKGRCERAIGRFRKAIAALKAALHACTTDPEATAEIFEELADLYVRTQEYDEAAYYQRRAAHLVPERSERMARWKTLAELARAS